MQNDWGFGRLDNWIKSVKLKAKNNSIIPPPPLKHTTTTTNTRNLVSVFGATDCSFTAQIQTNKKNVWKLKKKKTQKKKRRKTFATSTTASNSSSARNTNPIVRHIT